MSLSQWPTTCPCRDTCPMWSFARVLHDGGTSGRSGWGDHGDDACHRRAASVLCPTMARGKPTDMGTGLAALLVVLRSELGMRRLHRSWPDRGVGRKGTRRQSHRTQSAARTPEYLAVSHQPLCPIQPTVSQ